MLKKFQNVMKVKSGELLVSGCYSNWDVSSKGIFLDIMEPVFPDSCISQAKGDCFQYKGLVYWKGINYKGKKVTLHLYGKHKLKFLLIMDM